MRPCDRSRRSDSLRIVTNAHVLVLALALGCQDPVSVPTQAPKPSVPTQAPKPVKITVGQNHGVFLRQPITSRRLKLLEAAYLKERAFIAIEREGHSRYHAHEALAVANRLSWRGDYAGFAQDTALLQHLSQPLRREFFEVHGNELFGHGTLRTHRQWRSGPSIPAKHALALCLPVRAMSLCVAEAVTSATGPLRETMR